MTMTLVIVVLGMMVVILLYTTINLMRKVEKLEDLHEMKDKFIYSIFNYIIDAKKQVDELDSKGYVPSDDEFGQIYQVFQKVVSNMYNFLNRYVTSDKDGKQTEEKRKT